ncbi:MAG: hypothetical protein ACPGVO_04410 [Spirulinaceae cyanobacterium]
MTAFSPSDLPPSVNTLEKLLVWGNTVMQHINLKTLAIDDGEDNQVLAIASSIATNAYSAQSNTPYSFNVFAQSVVPLTDDYLLGGRPWESAIELSATPIPEIFKS